MVIGIPKLLRDPETVLRRRQALAEPHIAPLAAFVRELRGATGSDVSDFDPLDGGIHAECLFLLEAPGAKASNADGSGFISRDNPDETAKNFFQLNAEAGLPRNRTITWNAVPWYIGTGTRIRAASRADLEAAQPHLRKLLFMLTRLRVVVLLGRKAQRCGGMVQEAAPSVTLLQCPHPSPLALNGRRERRSEILNCLASVVRILG